MARRWHKDVNRWYKRLWLSFKMNRTLLAGLFFRGSLGHAQTVQILMNTLVMEIVVLCMQYSQEGEVLELNIVQVIVAGVVAALVYVGHDALHGRLSLADLRQSAARDHLPAVQDRLLEGARQATREASKRRRRSSR